MLIHDLFAHSVFTNTILNAIIITCLVLLVINAILYIPIGIKITKRKEKPLKIIIYICFRWIQKKLKNNSSSQNKKIEFKITDFLFSSNLNEDLKKQKENNFFAYLILEYARVVKLTYIPVFSSKDEVFLPLLGFGSWMSVAVIKRYVESTFRSVEDDYYQIMMDDKNQGLMFEIELKLRFFDIMIAMFKQFKLLKKTIKKKEG